MLKIVTGRSGSGKTTYTGKVLKEFAEKGNSKLLLIVPEQFSFASERGVLKSLSPKDAANIEVLSFTRLPDYVNRSVGGLCGTSADNGTKIIVMLRALESVKDHLEFYASHISSIALVKELISLLSEVQRERITPEMLKAAAEKSELPTFSLKLSELALIYKAYKTMLSKEFEDDSSSSDKLCTFLKSNNFFSGYEVVIDAFKGFTAEELEIIKYLIKQADNVYLTLCTNDPYSEDPSMIFGAVNDTAKRIIRMAKEESVTVSVLKPEETGISVGKRFNSPALAYLEKKIFYPTESTYKGEKTNDITLVNAPTLRDECNFVAATARRLMRTENIRLREMAVISRNENDYRRELKAAFERYEIPVYEDVRQPIMHQPIISLCKSVLTIMTSGFTTENILGYLKTGLSPLSLTEAAELENYALMWSLTSKDWYNEFTLNPDGMNAGITESTSARLEKLNSMRKEIIVPLKALKNKFSENVCAQVISEALYDFITKTNVQTKLLDFATDFDSHGYSTLATEQNRVWILFCNVLDKLAKTYGDFPTSLATYYNLFCAVLSVTDLGTIPHGLDEITIGAADRIRLDSAKVVFVVGCAEGVFPATVRSTGILTSADRANLTKLGVELSANNTTMASDERFIAYTALTAASDKVFISYHKTEGPSEVLLPSNIYTNVGGLFKDKIQVVDTSLLPPEYFAETLASLFSTYAALYAWYKRNPNLNDKEKTLEKLSTFRKILEKDTTYKDKLYALDKTAHKEPFRITDSKIATELFGKDMCLSASRVDLYHHCAFEYFCQYGLNIKPREKAELSSAVSGTVIHYVLEKVIAENGKEGLLSMNDIQRKAAVDKWLTTYLNESIGGFDDKTERFRYLYNRLSISLYDIIDRLCNEFCVSDFTPCDFELSIGNKDEGIDAYKISLPDGSEVKIYGSVDRVDKFEKNGKTYIRVVDYKSGGKEFVLSDILEGLNMQMLIYLFAIWDKGEERYGNVLPAGILYYPAKRNTVRMDYRNDNPDEIAKKKEKADRGNGFFLRNDDILEAMEHGSEGRFITIKKGGKDSLKDNLATLETMGLLKKKIDSALVIMSESLHKGQIDALPARGRNYDTTCQYCKYGAICGYEDGKGKDIPKLDNAEVIEILKDGGNTNV